MIVIDAGSANMRVGNSENLLLNFPTVIGRSIHKNIFDDGLKFFFGNEAMEKKGILNLSYPIKSKSIKNWQGQFSYLNQDFADLIWYAHQETNQDWQYVLITESSLNKKIRQRLREFLLEDLCVSGIFIANSAQLALLGLGKTTGLILDCGESLSRAYPFVENCTNQFQISTSKIGGKKCTKFLSKILNEIDIASNFSDIYLSSNEMDIIRDIKEKIGYVALDYHQEIWKYKESNALCKRYELPDGNSIVVDSQRFRCTELLFNPLQGELGAHQLILESISRCDKSYQNTLFQNIILTGCTCKFPNFTERLQKELNISSPKNIKIELFKSELIDSLSWLGGQFLSKLSNFEDQLIYRTTFEEHGNYRLNYI